VGVTAGTSTLKETVAAVVVRLNEFSRKSMKDSGILPVPHAVKNQQNTAEEAA
jgi:hypothetical protein